jgi:hypothetical protein
MDNNSNNHPQWRSVMRKVLISALILVFLSATAFADGGRKIQNRNGILDVFGSEICKAVQGKAQVHQYGVRFTVTAHGCTAGHVFTVWGIVPSLGFITVNCGGGIVLPNGQFKTICDVPIGNLTDAIDECLGIPEPEDALIGGGCAQVVEPGVLEDPMGADFQLDILTHDELHPTISMAQIRTLSTCSFWDGIFGSGVYPREDSCLPLAVIKFPAP